MLFTFRTRELSLDFSPLFVVAAWLLGPTTNPSETKVDDVVATGESELDAIALFVAALY